MRGQSQVVSVVIMVVLVLSAIALVLPWTYTMIQKRKDMKSVDDVYNFFQRLDDTIRNIAKNGGEESLELKVPGKFTVYPESSNSDLNNSIVFSFRSLVSFIAECDPSLPLPECWIPLNTPNTNTTGTLGVDSPSVIFGRTERVENKLKIEYRLWYRSLNDTPTHGYKIVLNTSDNTEKNTTFGFLRIQRINSTSTPALITTEINIIV
ncbi:MAG: hypothetical protein QMD36_02950 [Candidatus Aenigmarchaeota archaeon]|nr:hypothetical protein [Candidatus Aenigmarchaeota archaeon]